MYDFLWNLGSFVIALGLLITAHEYGHFWVARRCGVKVERFSIGFGKAIWRKKGKDGTEYVLALIPLGGYVKMLDERIDDVPESLKNQAFNSKTVWQRMAIVVAGPVANFLFAIGALYIMYLIGVPAIKPVVESVNAKTPAAIMHTSSFPQQIIAVSGQNVTTWEDVNFALVSHIGEPQVSLTLSPIEPDFGAQNKQTYYELNTSQWQFDPEKESPITALGLNIYRPSVKPEIGFLAEDGAAKLAGMKVGDNIISINGQPYKNWHSLVDIIRHSSNIPIDFVISRNDITQHILVTPKAVTSKNGEITGVIGMGPVANDWPANMKLHLQYGFIDGIGMAIHKTWQLIDVSVKMIGKLFTGDVSVKNLSGPISIAQGAGNSANYGIVYFLSFLALISVNLGIINLLPLPILDGGHLMYYLVEAITGKAVPEKVQEIGFKFGAALLFMLMSIAIFNDFSRL